MKVAYTLPILLICVLFTQTSSHTTSQTLTSNDLIKSNWRFYNDNGYLGVMSFLANGSVGIYANSNEQTWKLNGQNIL